MAWTKRGESVFPAKPPWRSATSRCPGKVKAERPLAAVSRPIPASGVNIAGTAASAPSGVIAETIVEDAGITGAVTVAAIVIDEAIVATAARAVTEVTAADAATGVKEIEGAASGGETAGSGANVATVVTGDTSQPIPDRNNQHRSPASRFRLG